MFEIYFILSQKCFYINEFQPKKYYALKKITKVFVVTELRNFGNKPAL